MWVTCGWYMDPGVRGVHRCAVGLDCADHGICPMYYYFHNNYHKNIVKTSVVNAICWSDFICRKPSPSRTLVRCSTDFLIPVNYCISTIRNQNCGQNVMFIQCDIRKINEKLYIRDSISYNSNTT